ncbi:MAG: hypothetical protein ACHP7E_07010 [Burkholderiales bacterium]
MAPPPSSPSARRSGWLRDELLQLLSLSGTLAGLCITGVAGMVAAGFVMVYTVL